jgi:hypothetical protein
MLTFRFSSGASFESLSNLLPHVERYSKAIPRHLRHSKKSESDVPSIVPKHRYGPENVMELHGLAPSC